VWFSRVWPGRQIHVGSGCEIHAGWVRVGRVHMFLVSVLFVSFFLFRRVGSAALLGMIHRYFPLELTHLSSERVHLSPLLRVNEAARGFLELLSSILFLFVLFTPEGTHRNLPNPTDEFCVGI
jgi:hypothetical protein